MIYKANFLARLSRLWRFFCTNFFFLRFPTLSSNSSSSDSDTGTSLETSETGASFETSCSASAVGFSTTGGKATGVSSSSSGLKTFSKLSSTWCTSVRPAVTSSSDSLSDEIFSSNSSDWASLTSMESVSGCSSETLGAVSRGASELAAAISDTWGSVGSSLAGSTAETSDTSSSGLKTFSKLSSTWWTSVRPAVTSSSESASSPALSLAVRLSASVWSSEAEIGWTVNVSDAWSAPTSDSDVIMSSFSTSGVKTSSIFPKTWWISSSEGSLSCDALFSTWARSVSFQSGTKVARGKLLSLASSEVSSKGWLKSSSEETGWTSLSELLRSSVSCVSKSSLSDDVVLIRLGWESFSNCCANRLASSCCFSCSW